MSDNVLTIKQYICCSSSKDHSTLVFAETAFVPAQVACQFALMKPTKFTSVYVFSQLLARSALCSCCGDDRRRRHARAASFHACLATESCDGFPLLPSMLSCSHAFTSHTSSSVSSEENNCATSLGVFGRVVPLWWQLSQSHHNWVNLELWLADLPHFWGFFPLNLTFDWFRFSVFSWYDATQSG